MTFYNTIQLTGQELRQAIADCKNQEERVLAIMINQGKPLTRWELVDLYKWLYKPVPGSSINRALSNLLTEGKVVKTSLVNERYGKPNYKWQVVNQTKLF